MPLQKRNQSTSMLSILRRRITTHGVRYCETHPRRLKQLASKDCFETTFISRNHKDYSRKWPQHRSTSTQPALRFIVCRTHLSDPAGVRSLRQACLHWSDAHREED